MYNVNKDNFDNIPLSILNDLELFVTKFSHESDVWKDYFKMLVPNVFILIFAIIALLIDSRRSRFSLKLDFIYNYKINQKIVYTLHFLIWVGLVSA